MKSAWNLLWFALLVILSYSSHAQVATTQPAVPRMVNFSGKALDSQRRPISGVAGVTFSIYKEQYDGSPLWMETQSVQADQSGNYTTQLGATKSEGLPLELFSSGQARWLGIRVNGGEEQPRVLLLSVPYALKAADAQTLGGLPPSAFVLAAPPNGTVSSTSAHDVAASPSAAPPPAAITGSGTPNYFPLFTAAATIGNSALFQSGTSPTAKIGINTSAPVTTLDVKGAGTFRGVLALPATAPATVAAGKTSQPLNLIASVFNSTTGTAVNQTFRLQSEAVGNNTSAASGTLNLLYATGANAAVETGLKFASNGQIGFATGQTFPGTISGVTAGPGLTGGGTSGNVPLSLLTTCASGQVLQWNGATWVCTTPKHGTVNSVSLNAPSSDFTVSGSPITGSGTLGLAWKVAPTSGNTSNAIVKRDSSGNFSAGNITAAGASVSTSVIGAIAVQGVAPNSGVGVFGQGGDITVTGQSGDTGVAGRGSDYGVTGIGRIGVFGSGYASSNTIGVGGVGNVGVSAQGDVYGVHAFNSPLSAGVGVWGESDKSDGLHGVSHGSQAAGVAALNDQGGDAILAVVTNGGLAGSFFGDVDVEGNVSKSGGSFKIDHPLDPAGKYLYHSFVESPDMKNIYDGNVITDAQGDAIVTMPDWFEALNRDFRYQLTVIGTFAQAIVATEIANGSFSIKTDKPNVKVSWQVTGVRQDAWANAHRIPIEEAKPDRERGFYLHPELFGAPEEKGIVWARHPEMMKRAHEKGPQLPLLTKH